MATLLERAAAMPLDHYQPALVIQAVNALQPLGKEKALDALNESLKAVASGQSPYGMFWVLRVLFDVNTGFPPVRLGQPFPAAPADTTKLPRFPIMMVGDVPLLVVRGYTLQGFPEPISTHLDYFRKHGVIRSTPLMLPASTADLQAGFTQQWHAAYGEAPDETILEVVRPQIESLNHPAQP